MNFRDKVLGPRWRLQEVNLLDSNEITPDVRIVQSLYSCLTCSACILKCPLNLNIADAVILGRELVLDKNRTLPQINFIKKLFKRYGNPLGLRANSYWADKLNIPQKGDTLLFVGCIYPFINQIDILLSFTQKIKMNHLINLGKITYNLKFNKLLNIFSSKGDHIRLIIIAKLLRKLGYEFAYLRDEPCCGEVLYNMGLINEFKSHAVTFAEKLMEMDVKRIIVLAPFCAYAFKHLYPKVVKNWDIEVLTLVEAIENRFNKGYIKTTKVTYHDPCYYTRYLNIIEAPRKIISRIDGVVFIEPIHNKENNLCVGDGGVELYFPKIAELIAITRVKELVETGSDEIITQCPTCILMIKRALKRLNISKIRVRDISEIVYESLKY